MTNPYEPSPSVETPTLSPNPTPQSTSFYIGGGFPTIAAISLVIGGVVGALILGIGWLPPIAIFGIPALGWLCATALLTFLIRDQSFTNSGRVALALLLPIPAYILYVPVCGFASMATLPFLGGVEYGPTTGGFCSEYLRPEEKFSIGLTFYQWSSIAIAALFTILLGWRAIQARALREDSRMIERIG